MMPMIVLMERTCNPGCDAPAAILVLHNAFINLVSGSLGLHRHDQCHDDIPLFDGIFDDIGGWHNLPWSAAMHYLHSEHVYHPLYRWLKQHDLNSTNECIDFTWMPVELQVLMMNVRTMVGDHPDNYWDMFNFDDLVEIDWEGIYNFHANHWVKKRDMEFATSLMRDFGFGHFDFAFFEHLSLQFSSPCR